jgi:hypothetical protein
MLYAAMVFIIIAVVNIINTLRFREFFHVRISTGLILQDQL